MPKRAFKEDVEALSAQAASPAFPRVRHVRFDDDNEQAVVGFACQGLDAPVDVVIICADIDAYPKSCSYFLSAENVAHSYVQALGELQKETRRRTLVDLVKKIDAAFARLAPGPPRTLLRASTAPHAPSTQVYRPLGEDLSLGIPVISLVDDEDDSNDSSFGRSSPRHDSKGKAAEASVEVVDVSSGSDGDSETYSLDYDDEGELPAYGSSFGLARAVSRATVASGGSAEEHASAPSNPSHGLRDALQRRIVQDLRAVRGAGFYFGVLAGMRSDTEHNLLAVSVEVSKLELSHRMLLAWDLDPSMYIVLLIRLQSRYAGYETLIRQSNFDVNLSFRIGKCRRYKPSLEHALAAFRPSRPRDELPDTLDGQADEDASYALGLSKIHISKSLSKMMNASFLPLARLHDEKGVSWSEAVRMLMGLSNASLDLSEPAMKTAPAPPHSLSLPLVAMQFALDRLRNCTKYCQSCHCPLDSGSLKPTVCSRELCLFQYIQLGLGRSLEHEILCQPNVIDLLVNFCYAALAASEGLPSGPIRTYPAAMQLKVLDLDGGLPGVYTCLDKSRPSCSIRDFPVDGFEPGQWVAIVVQPNVMRHGVVSSVDVWNSTIYLEHPHFCPHYDLDAVGCYVVRYTKDLDDVPPEAKAVLLRHVLDTLPPVSDLQHELEKPNVNDLKLVPGVSPAAAALLEWIIATNRSCILQIHNPSLQVHESSSLAEAPSIPPGYLQFCFLQGSIEDDMEFQRELEAAVSRTGNTKHPTLLAFHGSKIQNWHSILRTGLDYRVLANGRTYGHGVYYSNFFSVGLSYASQKSRAFQWPQAVLDLKSVVSLNEIINDPSSFTSSHPHYVVAQRNWGRFLYLFASGVGKTIYKKTPTPALAPSLRLPSTAKEPNAFYEQAPEKVAYGPAGHPVLVPLASMPSARNTENSNLAHATKRHQGTVLGSPSSGREENPMDATDLGFLKDVDSARDAAANPLSATAARPRQAVNQNVTPFQPGMLDYASLPHLRPPTWGTAMAQRALGHEVQRLQRLQQEALLPDLGWYIDFAKLDNLFQWIVELHSFDKDAVLAQDLTKRGMSSVVCELRFGPDYPISPPLVRVIRPRFVPFVRGGGGHVTGGGSLCMELLTSSGWTPANQIDSVLLQVHLAISTPNRPARIDFGPWGNTDYTIAEAMDGYMRAANAHGWAVPGDMALRRDF